MALATLSIDIEARLAKLEQGMDRAGRIAERSANQMSERFKRLDAIGAGLIKTFAAAFSVGMISAFISRTIDGVDALNDMADATGTTVENASALEDIAVRTGTSFETVTAAVIKMNQSLNGATKGSDAERALKQIGLDAAELRKIDPAEALLRIAQALSTFADDGNKGRLILELFGKSTREVAPLLKDLAEKGALNATVTTAQAQAAEKFNHQLAGLTKNITDAARSLAGDWLPAMNEVFVRIKALQSTFGSFSAGLKASLGNDQFSDASKGVEFYSGKLKELDAARKATLESNARRGLGILGEKDYIEARAELQKFLEFYRTVSAEVGGKGRPANEGGGGLRSRNLPSVGVIPEKAGKPEKAKEFISNSFDQDTINALRAMESTDTAKLRDLQSALSGLFEFQRETRGDPAVVQAIANVRKEIDALDPAMKKAEEMKKRIEAILSQTPTGILKEVLVDIEAVNKEFEAGKVGVEQWAEAMRIVTARLPDEVKPQMEEISEFAREASRNIQDALGDTILSTLDGKFSDIGKMWGNMIKRMVAEAAAANLSRYLLGDGFTKTGKIGGALGGLFGSGGGVEVSSGFFNFLSMFSGGFAGGGFIQPGKWGMTGEQGPEPVFGGRTGATVLPNGSGGKAGSTFNVNIQGDASENTLRLIRGALAQFEAKQMMRGGAY